MKGKGILKIVSKKRPWYERLLAAVFFSIAIYVIATFYLNNPVSFTESYYRISFRVMAGLVLIISFGIKFSVVINHHFNFELKKYRAYWSVGPFGRGEWEDFRTLDRVSTFLNNRNECEVNIWDIKNRRYRITAFDEIDDAVNYGRDLAQKLDIRFKERK